MRVRPPDHRRARCWPGPSSPLPPAPAAAGAPERLQAGDVVRDHHAPRGRHQCPAIRSRSACSVDGGAPPRPPDHALAHRGRVAGNHRGRLSQHAYPVGKPDRRRDQGARRRDRDRNEDRHGGGAARGLRRAHDCARRQRPGGRRRHERQRWHRGPRRHRRAAPRAAGAGGTTGDSLRDGAARAAAPAVPDGGTRRHGRQRRHGRPSAAGAGDGAARAVRPSGLRPAGSPASIRPPELHPQPLQQFPRQSGVARGRRGRDDGVDCNTDGFPRAHGPDSSRATAPFNDYEQFVDVVMLFPRPPVGATGSGTKLHVRVEDRLRAWITVRTACRGPALREQLQRRGRRRARLPLPGQLHHRHERARPLDGLRRRSGGRRRVRSDEDRQHRRHHQHGQRPGQR